MKTFLISLLIGLQAQAFTSGLYNCVKGNNNSICPQKLRFSTVSGTSTLKVIYSGDCNDQGPYSYGCQNESNCGDGQIVFKKLSDKSYDWANNSFGIKCRFELSTNN